MLCWQRQLATQHNSRLHWHQPFAGPLAHPDELSDLVVPLLALLLGGNVGTACLPGRVGGAECNPVSLLNSKLLEVFGETM